MAEFLTDKNEKIVYIPNELMLRLERLFFEYDGLRILVTQFGSESEYKPDESRFKILLDKYLESYLAYNYLLNDIAKKYVSEEDLTKTYTASFQLSALLIK